MITLFILLWIFFIFTIYIFLIRNAQVLHERQRILNIVADLAEKDLQDDWQKYYEDYEKISYNEMVFKFWIPIKSFYKFIEQDNKDVK